MKDNIYLGLVHHPIKNKRGDIVTTSVTNLDIHDIARSCRTFGMKNYFIVTPLEAQHKLVKRILGHWEEDDAGVYNPDRQDALAIARLVNSVEEGINKIKEIEGVEPLICVTGANFESNNGVETDLINNARLDKRPIFLLFGTGWGLHAQVLERAHFALEPIFGGSADGYNHLSVRSAVAIYLDRLNSASESLK
ncbi:MULTISPECIES: RNA methyltransferase [Halobacteriovorax]|uniref:RNA methyltransferase n=1 Tax=Halobacteriovorax vibrionivorans TaxID=2152716 RepID=A0ABY0IBX8_9BACT|nr:MULTISPECIES: RNA methyltransferase [Halobacteriovorax]AYF44290.1 SAM-dependent RNA methyltransferase [Halobacteriovorax sp. BALOs_7]RZF20462.1 RNA methyltransferase [Halobacteriovorax vibrionivorans]TGD46635.1 RNA methyltransferase [Halobacteriovorax sp. Y22]